MNFSSTCCERPEYVDICVKPGISSVRVEKCSFSGKHGGCYDYFGSSADTHEIFNCRLVRTAEAHIARTRAHFDVQTWQIRG